MLKNKTIETQNSVTDLINKISGALSETIVLARNRQSNYPEN